MSEKALLKCVVLKESDSVRRIKSQILDGQEFEIDVPRWYVILTERESENHCQEGWLEVELLGEVQLDQKCSIKLPTSTNQFGDRINVNSSQLKR